MRLRSSRRFPFGAAICGALGALVGAGPAHAATLCVNPTGSGGCFMTIQAAVDAAERRDLIDVAAGTYVENVVIGARVTATIQGAGPGATIVDGGGSGPVFDLTERSSRLTMSGVGVENGNPGIDVAEGARLTLSDCAVSDNVGLAGIFGRNKSTVKLDGCTIAGNAGDAGITVGLSVPGTGRLTVTSSTVSGNDGAGIRCAGKLTMIESTVNANGRGVWADSAIIKRSTISGNSGPGLTGKLVQFGRGTVRVSDSTISGNTAVKGGGVLAVPGMRFDRVTIADNSADQGGAIAGYYNVNVEELPIFRASIIANNTSTTLADCYSVLIRAYDGNLIDDPGCAVDVRDNSPLIVADPLLGPLQNNGGPTETHALGGGSPAIGVVTDASHCRSPDQRGVPRARPCDLGAFEAP